MIQAVSDKQYDIGMTGITIKDERKAEGRLLRSLHALGDLHAGARRREPLHRRQELRAPIEKLLVGAQAGTSPFYVAVYNVLDGNEQNPRIKLFETFGATVQALKAGDVDLVLTDSAAGKGYVDASGGKLKLIGGPLQAEDFGFIFPKGSDLVAPINAGDRRAEGRRHPRQAEPEWFVDYKPARNKRAA